MTVEQKTGLTKQLAYPTEVRAYSGTNVARFEIDLYFDDTMDYETFLATSQQKDSHPTQQNAKRGKAIFTIVKGRDEVHQTLIIPRLTVKSRLSREIFAVWAPYFDGKSFSKDAMNKEFLTDA